MILFTILAIVLVLLIMGAILLISVGGVAFIIVFADVLVCIGFILLIMRAIFRKKRK